MVLLVFDLLYLEGEDTAALPLQERKARLQSFLPTDLPQIRFSEHVVGDGPRFREHACRLALEGTISKRLVAGTGQSMGPQVLADSIITKLLRVAFLLPAVAGIAWWVARSGGRAGDAKPTRSCSAS